MSQSSPWRLTIRQTSVVLSLLLALFLVRVLAQFIQYFGDLAFLPGFEAWHSATLPYGWLLFSQAVIIAAVVMVITRVHGGNYRCSRLRALVLLWAGVLYFLFMLVRLVLSVTLLPDHPWFGAPLPAIFHLVLAGIVMTIGLYEHGNT